MVQVIGDPEVIHRGMMRSVLDDVTAADIGMGMDELRGLAADRDEALFASRLASAAYLGHAFGRDGDLLAESYLYTATDGAWHLTPPTDGDAAPATPQ